MFFNPFSDKWWKTIGNTMNFIKFHKNHCISYVFVLFLQDIVKKTIGNDSFYVKRQTTSSLWRKHLRLGGVRAPPKSQMLSSGLPGLASSPWRKHLRLGRVRAPPKSPMLSSGLPAWPVRPDESICDLGVRAPPKSQMSSSGLPGLARLPWTKAFVTW